jgi:hypothetical protein
VILKLNLAMGRSDSKIRALVGAVIRLVGRHTITIRELPVDFRVEIRERFTKVRVERAQQPAPFAEAPCWSTRAVCFPRLRESAQYQLRYNCEELGASPAARPDRV